MIAHSLGAMAAMLAIWFGTLSTERLVFLAPMTGLQSQLDTFADASISATELGGDWRRAFMI